MADPPAAPRPAGSGFLTLEEAAARIRSYLWVEERTFEVLGRWVPTVRESRVKALLAAQSRTHGWHAELWRDRVPAPAGLPVGRLADPPERRLGAFLAALAEPSSTAERLAGVYRVLLPAKIAAYRAHLDRASGVAEGPTCRWLRVVVADEQADLVAGEALLRGLAGPGDGDAHRLRLGRLLADAGGITGFDEWIVPNGAAGGQGGGAQASNL